MNTQDDIVTFLLKEIRALQKRVDKLEKHRRENPAAKNASLVPALPGLDQHPDL